MKMPATYRDERMAEFVKEALEADRGIDAGDEVYAAADVHAWLARRWPLVEAPR